MKILNDLRRRGLALFLVLTMCLGMIPGTAFAAETEAGLTASVDYLTLQRSAAEITYVRPETKSNVHVILVVDNTGYNGAARAMSTVVSRCRGLFAASGATATTISYEAKPTADSG